MTDDSPFGEMGDFTLDARKQRIERPAASLPICRRIKPGEKSRCPKGTPEKPNTWTPRNRQFWHYYQMVKAAPAGMFPTDGFFWELALMVREVEEVNAERKESDRQLRLISSIFGGMVRR